MSVPSTHSAQNAFAQPMPPGNITRRPGVFSQFVQTVAPDPIPSRMQFYRQGIGDYFAQGYLNGNVKYYQNLKKNPGMLSWVGGVTLGLGTLFTMFTRFRGAIHYGAALLALVWPVMHANRTFPKMSEAYQKAKDGNPTEGKEQFKKAINDTTYNVFHVFLKPMTFAFALAFILSLPRTARLGRELAPMLKQLKALKKSKAAIPPELLEKTKQLGWIDQNISLPIMRTLRIRENNPILRFLNIFFAPLERLGTRIENHVDTTAPTLSRWMQKMR